VKFNSRKKQILQDFLGYWPTNKKAADSAEGGSNPNGGVGVKLGL